MKCPYNLKEFGNIGGVSIPSLMVTRIANKLRKGPTTILGSSFGLCLSWSAMLLKTKPMVVPEMVVIYFIMHHPWGLIGVWM